MKWAEALVSRVCLAGKGPCPFPRRDDCKTACTYIAEVLDTTGHSLSQPVTGQGNASPIRIPATALTSGQSYRVRVRAQAVNMSGRGSAPLAVVRPSLSAPVVTEIVYEESEVVVRFQPVPGATSYVIEPLNGGGLAEPTWSAVTTSFFLEAPAGSPLEEVARYPAARLSCDDFRTGQVITIRMFAKKESGPGAILEPVLTDPSPLRLQIKWSVISDDMIAESGRRNCSLMDAGILVAAI
jgi:hypothetical protein